MALMTKLSTRCEVAFHVVELVEALGEGHVCRPRDLCCGDMAKPHCLDVLARRSPWLGPL